MRSRCCQKKLDKEDSLSYVYFKQSFEINSRKISMKHSERS